MPILKLKDENFSDFSKKWRQIMKKIIFFPVILAFFALFLFSCEMPSTGDIPTIGLSIPSSLTSSSDRTITKATGAPDAEGVFEPFRAALDAAQWSIDAVNNIIDSLNNVEIPETYEGSLDNGDYLEITTDSDREFHTRVNLYVESSSSIDNLYLQINYTKGVLKGNFILNLDNTGYSSDIEKVKVYYDGTDSSHEILKGWAVFHDSTTESIYPQKLYFHGEETSSGINFEGGVLYHYVFDDGDGNSGTNSHDYETQHVYAFRAVTDSSGEYATVNLYFPPASETDNNNLISIADDFLTILYTWVNYTENTDVQGDLTSALITWLDDTYTKEEFKASLQSWRNANPSSTALDAVIFLLELDNPIYYSGSTGYVSNGGNEPGYPDPSNLSGITFTYNPQEFTSNADFDFIFSTD